MAFTACFGNVPVINAAIRIGRRQDMMTGMTVCTFRGDYVAVQSCHPVGTCPIDFLRIRMTLAATEIGIRFGIRNLVSFMA